MLVNSNKMDREVVSFGAFYPEMRADNITESASGPKNIVEKYRGRLGEDAGSANSCGRAELARMEKGSPEQDDPDFVACAEHTVRGKDKRTAR